LVVSLHVRTGDLSSRLDPLSSRLESAARQLSSWGLSNGSAVIFIATDSRSASDRALMLLHFPTAQIGVPESLQAAFRAEEPGGLAPVFTVLLDKAVCIQADRFIGTTLSTYTLAIQQHRAADRENNKQYELQMDQTHIHPWL